MGTITAAGTALTVDELREVLDGLPANTEIHCDSFAIMAAEAVGGHLELSTSGNHEQACAACPCTGECGS